MTRINLLPWREELRLEKKKEFLGTLFLSLILACAIGVAWVFHVDSKIETQENRNKLLEDGITVLNAELKEIRELKQKRQQWLARMDVIQSLQSNRTEIVKIFDAFAKAVPDGIFFSSMTFKNDKISLMGYAESNNRISSLMRSLDDSVQFRNANLQKIEANQQLGDQGYRFELKVNLKKPKSLSEKSDGKKG
jgi:type IV pilus assembly protein PilN